MASMQFGTGSTEQDAQSDAKSKLEDAAREGNMSLGHIKYEVTERGGGGREWKVKATGVIYDPQDWPPKGRVLDVTNLQ